MLRSLQLILFASRTIPNLTCSKRIPDPFNYWWEPKWYNQTMWSSEFDLISRKKCSQCSFVLFEWWLNESNIEHLAWLKPISMNLFSSIHPQFFRTCFCSEKCIEFVSKKELNRQIVFSKNRHASIFKHHLRWIQRVSSIQITANNRKSIFYASLWNQRTQFTFETQLYLLI